MPIQALLSVACTHRGYPSLIRCVVTIAVTEPIVHDKHRQVTYRGITKGAVEHFLNIRFAHDTSGIRRFAPPDSYTLTEGSEVDATQPGPACPQSKRALPPFFDKTSETSEDCLNLRIARPVGTAATDKLPVVVWLHGGGAVKGSAHDSHYEPDRLITLSADLQKPVIYVSLQYRITIFGFASLPILKDQKSLNAGMRDQRVGLQWVKDNIAAFGGDPNRITVFGLSAGGTFLSLQLLAYGGEEGAPFTQLWSMSGPPGNALNVTTDAVETHTRAVAAKLGCGLESDEEILECMRSIPVDQMTRVAMEYSVNNHPPNGIDTFIPSIDGDFMPDRHTVLYKSGRFVKGIPIVYGWSHDDGSGAAIPASLYNTDDGMKGAFKPFTQELTDDDLKKFFSLYPSSDFETELTDYKLNMKEGDEPVPINFFRLSRMLRDLLFSCSSIGFGYEMSRQSKAIDPTFPGVRIYDFNQSVLTSMMAGAGLPYLGVCHGSDTAYILNGVFPEGQMAESDQRLARSTTSAFINFAYTGNPSLPGDEHFDSWPESFPYAGSSDSPLPAKMNLHLIGGPLGTGSDVLGSNDDSPSTLAGFMQKVIGMDTEGEGVEYGEMGSAASEIRQRVIAHEKLLERCAFIESLSEKLGI
ncbi:alpha/beta-hydrolase [Hypoxylon argillaceum]|nr:alpha/beta-hydrolase [Hypoxylon argillaceum]